MSRAQGRFRRYVIAVLLAVGVLLVVVGPGWYGDYLWFLDLGYERVFLTILGYRIGVFLATALVAGLVLWSSYWVAMRRVQEPITRIERLLHRSGIVVVAFLVGLGNASEWETVLQFVNATSFGRTDPIYGLDVSFYVYTLPMVNFVIGFAMFVVLLGLVASLLVYARQFVTTRSMVVGPEEQVRFELPAYLDFLRTRGGSHLSVYVGAFLVLLGLEYVVARYELLFSTRGAVFGVGATDATIFMPFLGLLAASAVIGGLVVLAYPWLRDPRAVYIPIALVIGFLLVGNVAGGVFQALVVAPDEFNKEQRYLEHEIEFTNDAYALNRIDEQEFPVSGELTPEDIDNNPGTIENIRLWDPRPLLTTYNELQIFRTYYQFSDIDIDRYAVDGAEREVMVSAREIDFDSLPSESQTWVNQRLVYTHGFGVAMSPVSKITAQGLPEFYIQDIPPNSSVDIPVTQPRIYYGETTTDWVIVNSGTRELDFPSGEQNVYSSYRGDGGITLDSTFRKILYSFKFGDPRIFLSDSVTAESRLQFNRDVQTRAPTIAPFLEYDRDPYIVVADGRLHWVYDAYTTAETYPYSDRVSFKGEDVNYVRNSVKVVIDAYTGEPTYYVAEPEDPVIRTYAKAFPGLFEPFEAMPASLQAHVRYPEDAFLVQAQQYLEYHMRDPQVFYNKEDAWRIPNEVARGQEIMMEPYYVIMSFPGNERPEFVMIQPYIPEGRENMIGWLAARSDPPNYGALKSFLFSKQQLVFGPMQVESRIDQDAEISQQITLWSQAGSSVIRGNLLAIPIEDTILYVEPLFLESRETGALPELKRAIVTHGDNIAMQPTLDSALDVLVGTGDGGPITGIGLTPAQLEEARRLYAEAQTALRNGDFETYAARITALGELLRDAGANGNATG